MSVMYDATNVLNLPAGADIYAGYDDGHWPNAAAIAARFPGKPVIRVTVFPSDNEGDVLDVEKGDANPADAPGWVQRRRAAGHTWPTVYCSESAWPSVRQAFAAQGVAQPYYWVAAYPGAGATVPAGAIAHQWIDHNNLYDESVVVSSWPPSFTPPTTAPGEDMIAHTPTGNGYWICKPDGSIWSFGDAAYLGGSNPGASSPMPAGHIATGFSAHPTQQGYWISTDHYEVYSFGASKWYGNA